MKICRHILQVQNYCLLRYSGQGLHLRVWSYVPSYQNWGHNILNDLEPLMKGWSSSTELVKCSNTTQYDSNNIQTYAYLRHHVAHAVLCQPLERSFCVLAKGEPHSASAELQFAPDATAPRPFAAGAGQFRSRGARARDQTLHTDRQWNKTTKKKARNCSGNSCSWRRWFKSLFFCAPVAGEAGAGRGLEDLSAARDWSVYVHRIIQWT